MVVKLDGRVTSRRDVQPLNASGPIAHTPSGMSMLVKDTQSEKVLEPIQPSDALSFGEPKWTYFSALQP